MTKSSWRMLALTTKPPLHRATAPSLFWKDSIMDATCPTFAGDSFGYKGGEHGYESNMNRMVTRWRSDTNNSKHGHGNHGAKNIAFAHMFRACVASAKEASASGSKSRPRPSITGIVGGAQGSAMAARWQKDSILGSRYQLGYLGDLGYQLGYQLSTNNRYYCLII